MEEGFIKLSRKIKVWGWYDDPNTLALWVHLLLAANDGDVQEVQGEIVTRGSILTTVAKLAKESGLTEKQVRIGLDKLVKTGEITKQGRKWTRINICKYAVYQDTPKETPAPAALPLQEEATPQPAVQEKRSYLITDNKLLMAAAERIYKHYPTKCPITGRNLGKTSKDKERLARLLRDRKYSEEDLIAIIDKYIADSKASKSYVKNFTTFLNNIPDYTEDRSYGELFPVEETTTSTPPSQQPKTTTYTMDDIRQFHPQEPGESQQDYESRIAFIVEVQRRDGIIIIDNEKQYNTTR